MEYANNRRMKEDWVELDGNENWKVYLEIKKGKYKLWIWRKEDNSLAAQDLKDLGELRSILNLNGHQPKDTGDR